MKKATLLLATICIYSQAGLAQTQVSGTIDGQTWTPANSPYLVVGDINVVNLVIQPGVTVLFDGDFVFEVTGVLKAVGTAQDSITFTRNEGVSSWKGILLNFVTPETELAYCKIMYANSGGARLLTSLPQIRNCTFANNSSSSRGSGIRVDAGSVLNLFNCVLSRNSPEGGIYISSGATAALTNCILSNNSAIFGIGSGILNQGTATVTNCVVAFNNGDGIYSGVGDLTVINSIVFFNTEREIVGSSTTNITYSNIQGGWSGEGNIDENPVFDNGSTFTLWEFSPCVDAGNPDSTFFDVCFPPSHGTQRNDMGAYGGPGACNWVVGPPPDSFASVSIDTLFANRGDTILVPVKVAFPTDSSASSAEVSIGGYLGSLDFIEIVTNASLTGDAGWTYQVNETDSLNISWFAGSENISGEGTFFWLKFSVPDTASGFIPLTLKAVVFNTGDLPVRLTSGGIHINEIFYGDVDLNGRVQAFDASHILKYLVGKINLNAQQLLNANVSLDTTVSALDATLILLYGVGLIHSLPHDTTIIASGTIAMHDQTLMQGQPIDIPLLLSGGDNIFSFEGKITFKPEHLIFNDISWPAEVDGFMIETNVENGEIRFAGADSIPDGQEGVFATLDFVQAEGLGMDGTTVTLEKLRWNEDAVMRDVASAVISIITGVDDRNGEVPTAFALHQNYPNPFNPSTTIRFDLPVSSEVKLAIYNVNGQVVRVLADDKYASGSHDMVWDGTDDRGARVTSGLYVYRFSAGEFTAQRKLIVMK